jgi:predicted  nucleic acid-binding Zn-ribbon protein
MIKDQVTELYIAMFQRAPSESEIDYWYNSAQTNGLDIIGLADTMVNAAKDATHMFGLEDLYPQYANYDPSNPDSVKDIINSVYSTIFNKDASQDPDGVNYWTNEVLNGKSVGEVIVGIEDAAKEIAENPDKYKDSFDENTLNQAVNAAHAFKAKVGAANEIATKISNVKTDAQSLQEMQKLIKDVKSDDDINKVVNEADSIKDKIVETKDDIKDIKNKVKDNSDMFDMKDDDKDDVQNTNLSDNSDNSLESLNDEDFQKILNDQVNNGSLDTGSCEDALSKMAFQLMKLTPDQQASLDNDLNQLILSADSEGLSLEQYVQKSESIYAKYGIDLHSYDEACGVYSSLDALNNPSYIDGYSI